ncbi:hypothetical protein PENTCL1PPCAC_8281, partial [Pristionchus entomophagus]
VPRSATATTSACSRRRSVRRKGASLIAPSSNRECSMTGARSIVEKAEERAAQLGKELVEQKERSEEEEARLRAVNEWAEEELRNFSQPLLARHINASHEKIPTHYCSGCKHALLRKEHMSTHLGTKLHVDEEVAAVPFEKKERLSKLEEWKQRCWPGIEAAKALGRFTISINLERHLLKVYQ